MLVRSKFASTTNLVTLAKDHLKVHALPNEEPFLDMKEVAVLEYEGNPNDMAIGLGSIYVAEESSTIKVFEFQ